jgi:hypothetical protein
LIRVLLGDEPMSPTGGPSQSRVFISLDNTRDARTYAWVAKPSNNANVPVSVQVRSGASGWSCHVDDFLLRIEVMG